MLQKLGDILNTQKILRKLEGYFGPRNNKNNQKELYEQREWLRVTLSSIGDAVIATDTNGIVLFINQVAEALTGYYGADALGRNIESVFNIISEETGLPAEIPIKKVLADGVVVGLANHTALISKEGSVYSIADSAAPIINKKGEIIGVVLVFRNETEKKLAEKQMQDSETRFRELFNNMSSGVIVYEGRCDSKGVDFIIADLNGAVERIEGVTKADIIGCSIKEVFPGVIDFGLFDVLEQVWRNGRPWHHPISMYKDNRINGWRENYIYKIPSGEIVVVYDDVTERKQSEEILKRYQLIFESVRDVLLNIRLDGQIIDANLAASNVYGYSRDELLKMNLLDLRGPETDPRALLTQIGKAYNHGILFETEHYKKDGSSFNVEVSSRGTTVNNEGVLLSVIRDITERKQAEENLRKSEEKFRNIVENASEGIFQTTVQGRFISVNPSFARIFGIRTNELIDNIKDIAQEIYVNPEERENILRILSEVDHVENYELEVACFTGAKKWISINAHTVRKQNGEINFIEGACTDITERKQTEEQLKYLSNRDILTGLFNRNYFETEMHRLEEMKHIPVGIIICDIDGLKLVNDTMGHKVGDELLVAATESIKACFRNDDLIARIGGDEFAVLLPFIGLSKLEEYSKRIQLQVEEYNRKNPKIPLSLSNGFAFRNVKSVSIYDLFQRADNNMYRQKLRSSQSARSAIVNTLMETIGARDFNTGKHSGRIQDLLIKFSQEINLTDSKLSDLLVFAQFHDIGKVGIPDSILLKPGPLTYEEKIEMQRHCEIGHRIAHASPDLIHISDLILKHQEWWDGNGYPLGIRGLQIPLECRMLAIVDAYDAMTSDRPYRKAMSRDEAIKELIDGKNTQFDPYLVDKFLNSMK